MQPGEVQALSPEPIEKSAGKPPWKPSVAVVSTWFFGPLGGGLVTYQSLKRCGQRRKARFTLMGAFAACIALVIIALNVSGPYSALAVAPVQGTSMFVFWFIQDKDFAQWKLKHPGMSPRNGWSSPGWGITGLIGLFAIAFVFALAG